MSKPRIRARTHIRALILDYGGVLSQPQDPSSVQRMLEILKQDADGFRQVYRSRRVDYDSGYVSGKEYWRGVLELYGLDPSDSNISRLIRQDIKSWTQINEAMIQFVTGIRDKVHWLAILSNMTRETLAYMRGHFDWLALFDECVFSCEVGANKPDREIYEHCLCKLDLRAHECLFVDDSIENVQGALEVGMLGLHFRTLTEFLIELDQFCLDR